MDVQSNGRFIVRLLIHLYHSLICLLHTERFACTLRSLAYSLAPKLRGERHTSMSRKRRFHAVSNCSIVHDHVGNRIEWQRDEAAQRGEINSNAHADQGFMCILNESWITKLRVKIFKITSLITPNLNFVPLPHPLPPHLAIPSHYRSRKHAFPKCRKKDFS